MRITIVPPDKAVKVEGVRKKLVDFDWTPFADVHAVQADIANNRAEVEFRAIDPDGPGPLPSVKPPNELIDAVAFQERFGAIIAAFDAAPAPVRPNPSTAVLREDQLPRQDHGTNLEHRLAAIEAAFDRLKTKFDIFYEEVSRVKGP